jgi:cell division protein FtsI (penicillin-binding protein 3)
MKRTKLERVRLGIIFVFVIVFFVTAFARLVHLQIILGPNYSRIVERQSSGKVPIPAVRGFIYDRNGNLVASNVYASSLYANPSNKRELREVASYLEQLFNLRQGTAIKRYELGINRFRWIDRLISDELAEQITSEAPAGLYMRQETHRKYPYDLVGRQVLGFTDIDNAGAAGIEYSFDAILGGEKGWADIRRDGLRNTFRVKEQALVRPVPGKSIVLTIDWRFQEIVEKELRNAIEKYNAKSGMAAFVDCNTGEVLAITHYDTTETNPHRPFKLRAISDQFEPGSSFKIFSGAALLDAEAINFDDSIFCENGEWKLDRRTLHDSEEHGWLNFRGIFELSSNIGLAKNAINIGGEEIYQAVQKFGIGSKTGIELPGEASGSIAHPKVWSDFNIATLSIGHGVAVTTLQLAMGAATIANRGTLYKPQIIAGYVDDDGRVVDRTAPIVVGHPLKESSADSLRTFMRGVVERGTANRANSKVVTLAGKTGTAQMVNFEKGGYYWGRHRASFVGFFPYEEPIIAGAIILENPKPVYYGGWTSAPTFQKIAERFTVVNPDLFADNNRLVTQQSDKFANTVEVPNLIGRDIGLAVTMADERKVKLRSDNDKGVVVWQYPPADRLILENDVILTAVSDPTKEGQTALADLKGLSIRQASAYLTHLGIKFKVKGNGEIKKQFPSPGNLIDKNAVCRLLCTGYREES